MALIKFEDDEYSFKKSKISESSDITLRALGQPVHDILVDFMNHKQFNDDDINDAKNKMSLFLSFFTNNNKTIFTLDDDDNIEELIEFIILITDTNVNLNWINTSDVTNMSDVFNGTDFTGDISKWNTSKVTNMSRMFMNCPFNGDIENWDTSNVTDMSFMFKNNPNFDKDISRWNTAKLRTARQMAENCPNFNKASVFAWDIHRCKDLYTMYGSVCKTIK